MIAEDVIRVLHLRPHPEGGHYRETYRHRLDDGGRGCLTTIHYLLRAGECSAWHRIDATEVWHYAAGAPLRLSLSEDGVVLRSLVLGNDLASGHETSRHRSAPCLAGRRKPR